MLTRILQTLVLLAAAQAHSATAQPVRASYAIYAAGARVLALDAEFDVAPERYHVRLAYQTVGAANLLLRSQQDSVVDGRFAGATVLPLRFYSAGFLRGQERVTQIDYAAGRPTVVRLVPPNAGEREEVPPERQANTIDTVSAMALLVRQVNQTGRCEGRVTTFDGRRLSELRAWTVSTDLLPATSRSSFSGQALHCEFEGRLLGGYMLGEDREVLQRPQHGSAWFAALRPGGSSIPVRVTFHTRWFGDATMFLADPQ